MELYDAQTGHTTKMKANECLQVASKGFKLLGKLNKVDTATRHGQEGHENTQIAASSHQGDTREKTQRIQEPAGITHRYFLRPRKNGVFSKDSLLGPQAPRSKDTSAPTNSGLVVVADDAVQSKAVLIPEAFVSDSSEGNATTPRATSPGKQKTKLSAWLQLENQLRRAQGKGPITINRADTVDARGHYM